jgi:hypothetical protein
MNKYLYNILMTIWTILFCPIIALFVYLFATIIFTIAYILNKTIKINHKKCKSPTYLNRY